MVYFPLTLSLIHIQMCIRDRVHCLRRALVPPLTLRPGAVFAAHLCLCLQLSLLLQQCLLTLFFLYLRQIFLLQLILPLTHLDLNVVHPSNPKRPSSAVVCCCICFCITSKRASVFSALCGCSSFCCSYDSSISVSCHTYAFVSPVFTVVMVRKVLSSDEYPSDTTPL